MSQLNRCTDNWTRRKPVSFLYPNLKHHLETQTIAFAFDGIQSNGMIVFLSHTNTSDTPSSLPYVFYIYFGLFSSLWPLTFVSIYINLDENVFRLWCSLFFRFLFVLLISTIIWHTVRSERFNYIFLLKCTQKHEIVFTDFMHWLSRHTFLIKSNECYDFVFLQFNTK